MTLLLVNVAVYSLDRIAPTLELSSRVNGDFVRVADGQYYRLITGAFVHGEPDHLLVNMLLLVGMGPTVERALGRWRFTALYLLAASCASVSLYLVAPPESTAIGSSGAVYGLLGAWLLWSVSQQDDHIVRAMAVAVVAVVIWAATAQRPLENVAHAAGGLSGLALMLPWRGDRSSRLGRLSAADGLAVAVTIGMLAGVGLRTAHIRPLLRPWTDSPGTTAVASVLPDGTSGVGDTSEPSMSSDGRLVAFMSPSQTAGGSVGPQQVYLRDTVGLTTIEVSVATSGGPSTGRSYCPMLSGDGRFVVFVSDGTDLVGPPGGDPDPSRPQVFVRDLVAARTMLVAPPDERAQPSGCPYVSADGRFIAFVGGSTVMEGGFRTGSVDLFVHDRSTGTGTRIAPIGTLDATGSSELTSRPSMSGDGRFVAFVSEAHDLVAGDTNGKPDVFVRDRESGGTIRASVTENGIGGDGVSDGPSLSGDGRFVAFRSTSKLTGGGARRDIFVRDLVANTISRVHPGRGPALDPLEPSLSSDGRYVAFQVPFNSSPTRRNETVVADRQTGVSSRVSVSFRSDQGGINSGSKPAVSADGAVVAFAARPEGGVTTIYVHDRNTKRPSPEPQGSRP